MRRLGSPRARPALGALGLLVVVLALGLTSCTGDGESETGSGSTPEPSSGDVAAVRATIESADLTDATSLDAVNEARFDAAATAAAEEVLGSGATGDARWAAVWTYASQGSDPEVLRPLLADRDASIRVMAAVALLGLGDAAGFDVLVAELTNEEILKGSAPPAPVWAFAALSLRRLSGEDLGPATGQDPPDLVGAQTAWRAWVDEHHDALRFDEATGGWVTP